MSSEELNVDSEKVIDYMIDPAHPYIDADTGEVLPGTATVDPLGGSVVDIDPVTLKPTTSVVTTNNNDYKNYLDYCANRTTPIGETSGSIEDANYNWEVGVKCTENNEMMHMFRAYTMDKAINDTMDEDLSTVKGDGANAAAPAAPDVIAPTTPTTTGGTVTIETFGYSFGAAPTGMQYVADVRNIDVDKFNFLPTENGYDKSKPRSAATVRGLVMSVSTAKTWLKKFQDVWTPKLHDGSKVAIGCSRGHHRSVSLAVTFGDWLKSKAWKVLYVNRDLSKSW